MTDQAFDAFGEPLSRSRRSVRNDSAHGDSSQFLARFGVTLFWALVIAIVSARVLVGV